MRRQELELLWHSVTSAKSLLFICNMKLRSFKKESDGRGKPCGAGAQAVAVPAHGRAARLRRDCSGCVLPAAAGKKRAYPARAPQRGGGGADLSGPVQPSPVRRRRRRQQQQQRGGCCGWDPAAAAHPCRERCSVMEMADGRHGIAKETHVVP